MWIASLLFYAFWLILKFVLHKGGYVHILLLTGITISIVQFLGYRKARYHRISSEP